MVAALQTESRANMLLFLSELGEARAGARALVQDRVSTSAGLPERPLDDFLISFRNSGGTQVMVGATGSRTG